MSNFDIEPFRTEDEAFKAYKVECERILSIKFGCDFKIQPGSTIDIIMRKLAQNEAMLWHHAENFLKEAEQRKDPNG